MQRFSPQVFYIFSFTWVIAVSFQILELIEPSDRLIFWLSYSLLELISSVASEAWLFIFLIIFSF